MSYYNGKEVIFTAGVAGIMKVDQAPELNSENPVSSGGVYDALQNIDTAGPDEIIVQTVDTPSWSYHCMTNGVSELPTENTTYFVTLKNTDGTPLGAPQFKLMTAPGSYATALEGIYTLVGDGTYQTGQGILGENNPVSVCGWDNETPIFRFDGVNSVGINFSGPYKRIRIFYDGTLTGVGGVNNSYMMLKLNTGNFNNYSQAIAKMGLAIPAKPQATLVGQIELDKVENIYHIKADTLVRTSTATPYGSSACHQIDYIHSNDQIDPQYIQLMSNTMVMQYRNGSKIICEVWYE